MKRKKVGILTWHYFLNFGSALQAYALKTTIERLGYDTRIINYRDPRHGSPSHIKNFIRILVSRVFSEKYGYLMGRQITYPFLRFHADYLKLSKASTKPKWLEGQFTKFSSVVCGSDQIWAPNIVNPVYLLESVPDHINKVSYAASIGLNDIPEEKIGLYQRTLKRFSSISVREEKGKELLQKKCDIEAQVVLDPTFTIPIDHWRTLERKPDELGLDTDKPFIFCYFLKMDNEYQETVQNFAEEKNCHIIGYSLKIEDHQWMENVTGKIGPREFLWLIHYAEYVITDSYHGTIFSLLNHKKFFTFQRFHPSDPICQNSRIQQLDLYFTINDHYLTENDRLEDKNIDYAGFEEKLKQLREASETFLVNALEESI